MEVILFEQSFDVGIHEPLVQLVILLHGLLIPVSVCGL